MHYHTKRIAAATILLGLVAMLVQRGQGDFVLWDDEEIAVNTHHDEGVLYGQSTALIVSGGVVSALDAYHFSTVDILGGQVWRLSAEQSSSVNMSGGKMRGGLYAQDSSTVNMSGGEIGTLGERWTLAGSCGVVRAVDAVASQCAPCATGDRGIRRPGKTAPKVQPAGELLTDTTRQPFGQSYLFVKGYIDTARFFYCPSWDHPYMMYGKSAGNFGGWPKPGQAGPTMHYMSSHPYRSTGH